MYMYLPQSMLNISLFYTLNAIILPQHCADKQIATPRLGFEAFLYWC